MKKINGVLIIVFVALALIVSSCGQQSTGTIEGRPEDSVPQKINPADCTNTDGKKIDTTNNQTEQGTGDSVKGIRIKSASNKQPAKIIR